MRRAPSIACALALSASVFASAPARAENAEGAWLVNLNTTLFAYSRLAFTLDNLPVPFQGSTGELVGWNWGPSANPVSLEIGYHLSDAINVGLLLELGYWKFTTTSENLEIHQSQDFGRFLIGPRIEYVLASTGSIRPFLVGVAGFTTAPRRDAVEGQDVARSISFSGLNLLAGAGVHWFLAPSFSLDLAFRGGYGFGGGTASYVLAGTEYPNVNATGSLVTATALLGASGWIP